MIKTWYATLVGAAFLAVVGEGLKAQEFQYSVEHQHALRNCRGVLIFGPDTVEYRTDHKQDSRVWAYTEIRQLKMVSPVAVEIVSYEDQKRLLGRDKIFRFRLLDGELTSELTTMQEGKTFRPVVTSVFADAGQSPVFAVRVKHKHTLGGCNGTLRIFEDRVTYESADRPNDSRLWRYDGLEGFSWTERYYLRIATLEETLGGPQRSYNFQLKEKLDPAAYDYLWLRTNPQK